MTTQAKQNLIDAVEAARKEEAASRAALGRLVGEYESASALDRGGYAWQLSVMRLAEAEKALADTRGKELDRIVTAITVAVAIAFLLLVSISAALRVYDTSVVARVTAPQVKLLLSGEWKSPRAISTSRVYVDPVALLGVSGRPATKFNEGASIELLGEVTLDEFKVLHGTAVTLFAEKNQVTFGLEGAKTGDTSARLLSFTINVVSATSLTIHQQGTKGGVPEMLAAGTVLSIGVAFEPGLPASLELDKPKPWSLLLSAATLNFQDSEELSTIVKGTLEVPNVAKSVPLSRYDDLVIGSDCKPIGVSVFNYDDEGNLSVMQEYRGTDVSVAVGSKRINVVPTWLEFLLVNVGTVTTLNSLLVLVTGLILWGLRARSVFRGTQ